MLWILLACQEENLYQTTQSVCSDNWNTCTEQLQNDLGLHDCPQTLSTPLIEGAYELLNWDLGPWPPPSEILQESLQNSPGENSTAKMYNFVMNAIQRTDCVDEDDFLLAYHDGHLQVSQTPIAYDYATVLVHEAAHHIAPPHILLPDGQEGDTDWHGAYGIQALSAQQALLNCTSTEQCQQLRFSLKTASSRVIDADEAPETPCPSGWRTTPAFVPMTP